MRVVILIIAVLTSWGAQAAIELWDQSLTLSGFASVSATRSDNTVPLYFHRGIEDEWCFDCDTTVGLQLDSRFSEHWRASAQVVKRPQDSFSDPQFEWGYLSWQGEQTEVRGGRLRMPLFLASDYYYVGNAYPWARPPVDLYDTLLGITAFNGLDLIYETSLSDGLELTVHPFYGGHNHENVDLGVAKIRVETDIQTGINFRLNTPELLLNFSYLYTEFTLDGVEDQMDIFTVGGRYEGELWEFWAEFEKDNLQHGGYLGVVMNLNLWRPYLMVARNWERLESLSYIGGVRYDLQPNLSINLEVQLTEALGDNEGQFILPPGLVGESTQANLVTLMLSYNF